MKKRITLFLTILMCISLCACGGNESTSGEVESSTDLPTSEEGKRETETTKETEEQIDYVVGEWESEDGRKIVFHDNKTCEYEDLVYDWKLTGKVFLEYELSIAGTVEYIFMEKTTGEAFNLFTVKEHERTGELITDSVVASFTRKVNGEEQAGSEGKNEFQREMTEDGKVVISKEEFASYITRIELTTENWKEYLDIVEITEEERNGFGELVGSATSIECIAKNALGWYFDDVAISFQVNSTGESLYCEDSFHRLHNPNSKIEWENYTIDDLTCEKIVGDVLIFAGIPEECLSVYEDGAKFICVGTAEDYMVIEPNNPRGMSMDISLAYMIFGK